MPIKQNSKVIGLILTIFATLLLSFLFLSVFVNFYVVQFAPVSFDSMYSLWSNEFDIKLNGFILAYSLFLPLFTIVFVLKKRWLVWLLLIFIPFVLILIGGIKHLLWFFIFTIAGGLIGWLINVVIRKYKR